MCLCWGECFGDLMICIKNLRKDFGAVAALQGISLEVSAGEIFAFLGPNGAGKTTTINILTTLIRPTNGQAEIDGFDTTKHAKEVRKRLGIVFQESSLDEQLTAYENLDLHAALYAVPKKRRKARIEEALELFELFERRNDLVRRFSGGMRRRLEIARCMLHTPKVIFLDEPTLGLDPQTRHQLWTHVRKVNADHGVTVFLTTHYLEEAASVADRIAIIDHGSIVALGTVSEIKQQTGMDSLEGAFLQLTGYSIREEKSGEAERIREMSKLLRR